MSESKHTPGPWHATEPDASYHDVIRVYADNDGSRPIAACPQRNSAFVECISGATNATTEAAQNARLIAAAPDLLEACERVLNSYGETAGDVDAGGAQTVTLTVSYEVMAKLAAAIAKATGEKD